MSHFPVDTRRRFNVYKTSIQRPKRCVSIRFAPYYPDMHYFYSEVLHCVRSVRIRSFCGPYFSTFGLNTERYAVCPHIQSEYGKMWTIKTPNANTFYAVLIIGKHKNYPITHIQGSGPTE